MNKKIIGIAVFVFALIFGPSVFADSDSKDCGEGFKNMVASLKLDDGQQAKIKAIKDQLKTDLKTNWEQMKPLHEQIKQQIFSDNMDSSKLDDLIKTKVQLIGNMIKAKTQAKHQIYGVLNPQQRTQFQQMQKDVEEKIAKKYEKCHDDD